MSSVMAEEPAMFSPQPTTSPVTLRVWPGVVVAFLQLVALGITVTPAINNRDRFFVMMGGPFVCGLLFLVWWFAFSRTRWRERLLIPAVSLAVAIGIAQVLHPSTGLTLWIYGFPLSMLLIVGMTAIARTWRPAAFRGMALFAVILGWSWFPLVRLEGFDGAYWPEYVWRWSPTVEQKLLAETAVPALDEEALAFVELQPGDWPGFRGPARTSRVEGVAALTDLSATSLREVWRMPVGPAWSSFAIVDGRLYSQEQRGETEVVCCYDAATGRELWRHEDDCRFSDVVAGPGPRATPTFADGRVFTFGAKAILNSLDAATGRVLWRRDLMAEINAKLPVWGFSASPLVVGETVIVYAGGDNDQGLVAYGASDGSPRWHVGGSGMNFASAQPVNLGGEELVLFCNEVALLAIHPADGNIAFSHRPTGWNGPSMVQPQVIEEKGLIVPLGDGVGVARLRITKSVLDWSVTEEWSTKAFKPSFNDFVIHEGYLYGFDQNLFACLDATTGERRWKRGRYGFGQVLLLADASQLLITTESGELVLVAADPEAHRELGRLPAVTGKTWNHPAIAHGRLYVRSEEEAACFELPLGSAVTPPAVSAR